MIHIYGIKSCSTVKKALNWLEENQLTYEFHDFKKEPPSSEDIALWQQAFGWEPLVNRRGTTWRKVDKGRQDSIVDAASAESLMLEFPSLIKRPILQRGSQYLLGFDAEEYQSIL